MNASSRLREILEGDEIVDAVQIPVIADADNGYGSALNAWCAVKAFAGAGPAAGSRSGRRHRPLPGPGAPLQHLKR